MPSSRHTRSAWLNRAFAALADSTRREIVEIILDQPRISIGEVCSKFSCSRFTVMRHLNVLEDAELLRRERRGTVKHLVIEEEALAELRTGWLFEMGQRCKDS